MPPFLSDDLTYEHDHLKTAYARLVEQTLRSRPGVLTVELEEAHAIAREVRLTGDEIQAAGCRCISTAVFAVEPQTAGR